MFRTTIILIVSGLALVSIFYVYDANRRASWQDLLKQGDAAEAYRVFKDLYADSPYSDQHNEAHRFGSMLYESIGLAGIAVCDRTFDFGCFHAFFSKVIADLGPESALSLAEECRARFGERSTGCEHGIGHGIMEYTGRDQLDRALSLCALTQQKYPLFGCTGGLFMEYNSATIFEGGKAYTDVRPFDPLKPRHPCDTVGTQYSESCYFEISLWWKTQVGADSEKISALCNGATRREDKDACAKGWGTIVAENVDYVGEDAVRTCERMRDERASHMCVEGAAMRFSGSGRSEALSSLCAASKVKPRQCAEK